MSECPSKRCDGELETWATGLDQYGAPVSMSLCNVCGRLVETTVEMDERQATLFGDGL